MIQKDFFAKQSDFAPRRIEHGGDMRAKKRKLTRPLDSRRALHVVLKSSEAQGTRSFLWHTNDLFIDKTVEKYARKFHVTVQRFENMGNHIHMIAKFKRREDFQNFLRTITAPISRFITKARKGKPFGRKFWDALAFTRVITGRRDYVGVVEYLDKNHCEREYGPDARVAIEKDEKRIRDERAREKRITSRQHRLRR